MSKALARQVAAEARQRFRGMIRDLGSKPLDQELPGLDLVNRMGAVEALRSGTVTVTGVRSVEAAVLPGCDGKNEGFAADALDVRSVALPGTARVGKVRSGVYVLVW